MRMVIRSTGNVQVRKVYLTQFCDMKSIVALYCSSHSTRLDRWLSWWYPVYILLNPIHCFWTRTTQRVFPFNFYLCNCIYFHVQYPPCRKLWNCGKAPEFELWPALILKEESTKEEEEEDGQSRGAENSMKQNLDVTLQKLERNQALCLPCSVPKTIHTCLTSQ